MLRLTSYFYNKIENATGEILSEYQRKNLFQRIFPDKKIIHIEQKDNIVYVNIYNQFKLKWLLYFERNNITKHISYKLI